MDATTTTPTDQPKKRLDPDTNRLQISGGRRSNHFVFLSKIFLNKFEEVELHALGQAISNCVEAAATIERFELAKITNIRSFTYESEEGEDNQRGRGGKKVKMIITIARSAKFFDLVDRENL